MADEESKPVENSAAPRGVQEGKAPGDTQDVANDKGANDAAQEADADKGSVMDGLREEIRTQLANHLEQVRKDVTGFLEGEIRPIRDDLDAMGKAIDKLEQDIASVSPEGAANLLQDVQKAVEDCRKVITDVKPLMDRVPALEAKIKHFL